MSQDSDPDPGLVSGRHWPDSRRSRWLRVFFSAIWLAYLAQPFGTLLSQSHSGWWLAAALTVTGLFCVAFVVVVTGWSRYPVWARRGLVLLFPLAAAFSLMFRGQAAGGHVIWIYVSSATGWVVSDRRLALRVVAADAACYLLFSWLGGDSWPDALVTLITVVFVGLAMSGLRAQIKLLRELRRAREEVVKLAANEERLRLARDMHDLTGQSLSMITLKSELAARLLRRLPEGADRDRALAEAEEVAAVSRQALRDIREAISGYRRPTLAVEAITARSALESAQITVRDDPDLMLASGTFDPDAEAALAWCLREAVTNVVRHSGASTCRVTLTRRGGALSLTVRDDGRGGVPPGMSRVTGTGLHGMAERLGAVGGALELRPDAAPGFCLVATVPAAGQPVPGTPVPSASAPGMAGDAAPRPVTVTE